MPVERATHGLKGKLHSAFLNPKPSPDLQTLEVGLGQKCSKLLDLPPPCAGCIHAMAQLTLAMH